MNTNEWIKQHRDKRKAAGLCIECGKPAERLRCDECQQRGRDSQKRSKDKRQKKGLCVTCGKPRQGNYRKCQKCRIEQTKASKRSYGKKIANGLCVSCGKPTGTTKANCEACNIKRRSAEKKRRARYTSEGRCRECGADAQISNRTLRGKERGNYCKDCWFKVLSGYLLGSRRHWQILIEKLNACGWRCPYSGEKLILGDNLSFDHMDPICRFPEKRHDPDNLEPISWQVNLMKRDLTKTEFLALVKMIYLNSNSS